MKFNEIVGLNSFENTSSIPQLYFNDITKFAHKHNFNGFTSVMMKQVGVDMEWQPHAITHLLCM